MRRYVGIWALKRVSAQIDPLWFKPFVAETVSRPRGPGTQPGGCRNRRFPTDCGKPPIGTPHGQEVNGLRIRLYPNQLESIRLLGLRAYHVPASAYQLGACVLPTLHPAWLGTVNVRKEVVHSSYVLEQLVGRDHQQLVCGQ